MECKSPSPLKGKAGTWKERGWWDKLSLFTRLRPLENNRSKHSRGSGKPVLSRLDFAMSLTSPWPLSARINQPSNHTSPNCAGITQFQSYPCVTQGWLPTSKASPPPSSPFRETSSTEQGLFHNLVLMQSATYEYLTLLGTSINHLVLRMSGQNFNLFYS